MTVTSPDLPQPNNEQNTRMQPGKSVEMKVRVVGGKKQKLGGKRPVKKTDADLPVSNILADPFKDLYGTEGSSVMQPPYDIDWMIRQHEYNSILGPCVEAMSLNTVGFGYHLEPTVKLEEIEESQDKDNLELAMKAEKNMIESFFKYSHADKSFIELSQNRAFDKHLVGNGFWEITRFRTGKPAGIEHVPAYTVRLMRQDLFLTTHISRVKIDDTNYVDRLQRKRFRRYMQIREGKTVYFKEFGDPRILDSKSGIWMTKTDPETGKPVFNNGITREMVNAIIPATEILHFVQYCPYSPYGVPRWMGNVLSVLGSRAFEEINSQYADNKSIPPMAIMVSGGTLTDSSVNRLQSYITDNIKGRDNFHSVMILETESAPNPNIPGSGSRGSIEIKPLSSAMQSDEMFGNYDKRARDKIRASFRLPPVFTGDTLDYNRATIEESTSIAEKQVFVPERMMDDFILNRKLLTAMGVRYWEYKSNSSVENTPEDQAAMYGILKPEMTLNEARKMISLITNEEYTALKEDWADNIPLSMLAIYLTAKLAPGTPVPVDANGQPLLLAAPPSLSETEEDQGDNGDSGDGKDKEQAPIVDPSEIPTDEITKAARYIHAINKNVQELEDGEYLLQIDAR